MRYTHIAHYIASTLWSILPEKMDELLSVFAFRAAGHSFTAEEIQARIGNGSRGADASKRGAVAVIPLRGVIAHRMGAMEESSGGMSAERFTAMVKAAAADPQIATIVLDVDSPGGTIPGVPEAADAVYEARGSKRIVAVANSMMASAAYWIASQASEIVAIPSAIDRSIGSIGVFAVHQDLSNHLKQEGIAVSLIKAGKHKADGNPFEPLSDESRAHIQASVDGAYRQFLQAVARGRGASVSEVKAGYGEGRALPAPDALKAGLIDRIATFDEVIGGLVGKSSASMRADLNPVVLSHNLENLTVTVTGAEDVFAGTEPAREDEADRLRRLERF